MKTVAECQAYVDRITTSDWWTTRHRYWKVPVKDGRGRRSACASWDGSISLPLWARTPSTILHELAHVLAGLSHGHDGTWKAAYHALARRFGPPGMADELAASWKGKPHGRFRGLAPKVKYPPHRETCAACGKTARRMTWEHAANRYCTRRCALANFERFLRRVA